METLEQAPKRTLIRESVEGGGSTSVSAPTPEAPYWTVTGLAGRADYVNYNLRMYPKRVVEASIQELKGPSGLIENRQFFTELDHPEPNADGERVPLLQNTVGFLTDMWVGEGDAKGKGLPVYFTARIADNDKGRFLVSLMQAGARIGASTRGYGTFSEESYDKLPLKVDVAKTFSYIGLDWVALPSVADAGITTAFEHRALIDIINQEGFTSMEEQNLEATEESVAEGTVGEEQAEVVEEAVTVDETVSVEETQAEGAELEVVEATPTETSEETTTEAASDPDEGDTSVTTILALFAKLTTDEVAEGDWNSVVGLACLASALQSWKTQDAIDDALAESLDHVVAGINRVVDEIESLRAAQASATEATESTEAIKRELVSATERTTVLEAEVAPLRFESQLLELCNGQRHGLALFNHLKGQCESIEEASRHFEAAQTLVKQALIEHGLETSGKTIVADEDNEPTRVYTQEQLYQRYLAGLPLN